MPSSPALFRLLFLATFAATISTFLLLQGVVSPMVLVGEHLHLSYFGSGAFVAGFALDRLKHHTVYYSDLNTHNVCVKGSEIEKLWSKPLGLCPGGQYSSPKEMIAIQVLGVTATVLALLTVVSCAVVLYFARQERNKDTNQMIMAFSITACALALTSSGTAIAEFSVWVSGHVPVALLDGKSVVPIWSACGKHIVPSPVHANWSLNTRAFDGIVVASLLLIFAFVVMLVIGVKAQDQKKKNNNEMELTKALLLKGEEEGNPAAMGVVGVV